MRVWLRWLPRCLVYRVCKLILGIYVVDRDVAPYD